MVKWVRRAFIAQLINLGVASLSFLALAFGGGHPWRYIARISVVVGVFSVLFMIIAQLSGAKMMEDVADDDRV